MSNDTHVHISLEQSVRGYVATVTKNAKPTLKVRAYHTRIVVHFSARGGSIYLYKKSNGVTRTGGTLVREMLIRDRIGVLVISRRLCEL